MYKHNIEALLHNHHCCGKAISITYSECVSIVLFIQHAMYTSIVYCHLWQMEIFSEKNLLKKQCVFFSTTFV